MQTRIKPPEGPGRKEPPPLGRRRLARGAVWLGAATVLVLAVIAAGWLLPAEYLVSGEIVMPRSPERVWERFIEPARWSEWVPGLRSVSITSEGPQGVGSRRRIVSVLPNKRELTSEVEVIAWDQGKRYAHRHLGDSLDGWNLPVSNGRVDIALEPVAERASRLRVDVSYTADGPLARWWSFVVAKPWAERFLDQRLDELHAGLQRDVAE